MANPNELRHARKVLYPFHGSHPGMPDLFHVRCREHADFGFCGTKDEARDTAVQHDKEAHDDH